MLFNVLMYALMIYLIFRMFSMNRGVNRRRRVITVINQIQDKDAFFAAADELIANSAEEPDIAAKTKVIKLWGMVFHNTYDGFEELLSLDVQSGACKEQCQQHRYDKLRNGTHDPQNKCVYRILDDWNETGKVRGEQLCIVTQSDEIRSDYVKTITVILKKTVIYGQNLRIQSKDRIDDKERDYEYVSPLGIGYGSFLFCFLFFIHLNTSLLYFLNKQSACAYLRNCGRLQ